MRYNVRDFGYDVTEDLAVPDPPWEGWRDRHETEMAPIPQPEHWLDDSPQRAEPSAVVRVLGNVTLVLLWVAALLSVIAFALAVTWVIVRLVVLLWS